MGKHQITIELDDSRLGSYQDTHLAMCWHLAQANPAPHGDRAAGELVERIGREIIRRWLKATPPELWRHQGRDHYWQQLRQLATFTPGTGEVGSPEWHDGIWVPRATGDHGQAGGNDRPPPDRHAARPGRPGQPASAGVKPWPIRAGPPAGR
jgi:hypothetical protein